MSVAASVLTPHQDQGRGGTEPSKLCNGGAVLYSHFTGVGGQSSNQLDIWFCWFGGTRISSGVQTGRIPVMDTGEIPRKDGGRCRGEVVCERTSAA